MPLFRNRRILLLLITGIAGQAVSTEIGRGKDSTETAADNTVVAVGVDIGARGENDKCGSRSTVSLNPAPSWGGAEGAHAAGKVTEIGEETKGEGSICVVAVEGERGARSLGRKSCLLEKENEANLSEERGLLL